MTPHDVVTFWRAAGAEKWFAKDDGFDDACRLAFADAVNAAARGDLDGWAATPDGSLALLLLLDQMPRNLFRGSPRAFATDPKAREMAEAALANGHDQTFEPDLRQFFYLPFMHSEDLADQDRSIALYEALGLETQLKFAHLHRDPIARFGRFPHRNAVLGRATTAQEKAFLEGDGFKG
jgi:uncharacterized protein (DUF924 family)